MEPKLEMDILIRKMFEAAAKERFAQLSQKYDRELVFRAWVDFAKKGGRSIPPDLQWHKGMTLAEALASLETHFQSIEENMKKREEK